MSSEIKHVDADLIYEWIMKKKVLCLSDLKRNEYTPDKVTFPQEDPPNPGGGVKESRQSMRLML